MVSLMCQIGQTVVLVIQSNSKLVSGKYLVDDTKVHNKFTLSKGDYPGQMGWEKFKDLRELIFP